MIENPCVGGSIPPRATKNSCKNNGLQVQSCNPFFISGTQSRHAAIRKEAACRTESPSLQQISLTRNKTRLR